MDLSRRWTMFACEVEYDAFGMTRLIKEHYALVDRLHAELSRREAGEVVVPLVAVDFDPMRDAPDDTIVRPLTALIIDEIPGRSYGAGDMIVIRRRAEQAKGGEGD